MQSMAPPEKPIYVRMAESAMELWRTSGPGKEQWNYERGVLLYAIQQLWCKTRNPKHLDFVRNRTDAYLQEINESTCIPIGYKMEDYNLDNIRSGTVLLFLWKQFRSPKYKNAADLLRSQLKSQPRTNELGFWHKQIYPYQMWLDGLFMAEPFYAEYTVLFEGPDRCQRAFDDVAFQFILMEKHARDPVTGLLYHGYDESRKQPWSDPVTGCSKSFWGRSVGWYMMALVDVLDLFPKDHPNYADLVTILQRLCQAVSLVQDTDSGVWWEVLDQGGREGNYLESSASAMFVYGIAKAVRMGYIYPKEKYQQAYEKGFYGILNQFVVEDESTGLVNLNGTVSVGGLGASAARDGSYQYYISEKVVINDAKGVGPFLLACLEVLP